MAAKFGAWVLAVVVGCWVLFPTKGLLLLRLEEDDNAGIKPGATGKNAVLLSVLLELIAGVPAPPLPKAANPFGVVVMEKPPNGLLLFPDMPNVPPLALSGLAGLFDDNADIVVADVAPKGLGTGVVVALFVAAGLATPREGWLANVAVVVVVA